VVFVLCWCFFVLGLGTVCFFFFFLFFFCFPDHNALFLGDLEVTIDQTLPSEFVVFFPSPSFLSSHTFFPVIPITKNSAVSFAHRLLSG